MFGRLLAGLLVVGLAFGVWILLTPEKTGDPATTIVSTSTTTTIDSSTSTTTTTLGTTTTVVEAAGPIETVEEAEALLTELWFGWFEGIYNQDEERIKEVVASQNQLDAARDAFGVMTFDNPPTLTGIAISDIAILRADEECTAIWATSMFGFRDGGTTTGVEVLRFTEGAWKSVGSWVYRNDLWEQDCDGQLEALS